MLQLKYDATVEVLYCIKFQTYVYGVGIMKIIIYWRYHVFNVLDVGYRYPRNLLIYSCALHATYKKKGKIKKKLKKKVT